MSCGTITWFSNCISTTPGTVLMVQQYAAGEQAGNRTDNSPAGLGVDEVNTFTLERRRVETPNLAATRYITDGHGTVRLMSTLERSDDGYLKKVGRFYYRLPGSREWKPLSTVSALEDETGFHPVLWYRRTFEMPEHGRPARERGASPETGVGRRLPSRLLLPPRVQEAMTTRTKEARHVH